MTPPLGFSRIISPAGWTEETIADWNREYADKPFHDLLREVGKPFVPTENGILYRDRRAPR